MKFDYKTINMLCDVGSILLFVYSDIDSKNEELEVGIVKRYAPEGCEVEWHVLTSTSGCKGMRFNDWYSQNCPGRFEQPSKDYMFTWCATLIV